MPSSANNTSNATSPQHQYTATESYHVTAIVTCGANTQTIEEYVAITEVPALNPVPTFTSCEDLSDSGISSSFNTAQLKNMLVGAQQNVTLAYYTTTGEALPGPLPNPFTNTVPNNQNVVVRAYFGSNASCYAETTIVFSALATPAAPTAVPDQSFCVQQNATVSGLAIVVQNIKWYDAMNSGNLIATNSLLQDGATYYASQHNGNCESSRVAITVRVYATPVPVAASPQSFCSVGNPALNNIAITGSGIQWYLSASGGMALPAVALLSNGTTYYASQTANSCESVARTVVTVNLITSLNANDYAYSVCDYLNDGIEVTDLSQYNPQLLSDISNAFAYYHSQSGAENLIVSDQINTPSQHPLSLGTNDIYVRITSANGCTQVVTLSLTLMATPVISLPDVVPICENTTVTIKEAC